MTAKKKTDRQVRQEWEEWYRQFMADAPVETGETPEEKARRIAALEADDEAWFRYYFPGYCTAEPAPFHIKATRRLMGHDRWYEVRAWSRELAKSARAMMEVTKLALTGRIHAMLLVSNSADNAERLLKPFKDNLEHNLRIINDYGVQVTEGQWESAEFVAKCGCSFRALGAGQSPRGTRHENYRPDFILCDDLDTDEECRNPERVKQKWEWVENALMPTVSVSGRYRFLFNGNIIARDCCIVRAMAKADHTDIVNIRDKDGNSTWPQKNSEKDIDDFLSKLSTRAAQHECFNNPISEGDVFREMVWGKLPPLNRFREIVIYADPSYSNSKRKESSTKAVVAMGMLAGTYYLITCRLNHATNDEFAEWIYELHAELSARCGSVQLVEYIECNALQDPFHEQVYLPLFAAKGKKYGWYPSVRKDTRKKPEKFERIEGNLEPLARDGKLVFNEAERDNPHMQRMEEQFLLVSPSMKSPADGPDAVEGGVFILRQRAATMAAGALTVGLRPKNKRRV